MICSFHPKHTLLTFFCITIVQQELATTNPSLPYILPHPSITYSPMKTPHSVARRITSTYSNITEPMQKTPPYKLTPPSPRDEGDKLCPSMFSLSNDESDTSKELNAFIKVNAEKETTLLPIFPFNATEFTQQTEGDKRSLSPNGSNDGTNTSNNDISGLTSDASLEDNTNTITPNSLDDVNLEKSSSPPELKSVSTDGSSQSRHSHPRTAYTIHPLAQWEQYRKQQHHPQLAKDDTVKSSNSHDYQTTRLPPRHDGQRGRPYPPLRLPFRPHRNNTTVMHDSPRVIYERNRGYATIDVSVTGKGRDVRSFTLYLWHNHYTALS